MRLITRIDHELLKDAREIATRESKPMRAVIDEALRDFIEKHNGHQTRPEVMIAFGESLHDFGSLYRRLAK